MRCRGMENSMTCLSQGCHLAFLKLFARNEVVWLFSVVLNVEENVTLLGLFWQNLRKTKNFLRSSKICSSYWKFGLSLAFFSFLLIWPPWSKWTHHFGQAVYFLPPSPSRRIFIISTRLMFWPGFEHCLFCLGLFCLG